MSNDCSKGIMKKGQKKRHTTGSRMQVQTMAVFLKYKYVYRYTNGDRRSEVYADMENGRDAAQATLIRGRRRKILRLAGILKLLT